MIEEVELKALKQAVKTATTTDDVSFALRRFFKTRSKIAYGGYATVFVPNGKDYAIKYFLRGDNDSYREYAKYAMKNNDKYENLPKVFSIFKTYHIEFFILEKLKPSAKVSNSFTKKFFEYDADGEIFASAFNPLSPVLKNIIRISRRTGSFLDLGGENVMVRSNGIPVITDPLAD